MAQVDGQKVAVGDRVGFKADIEMYGKIVKITGSILTIRVIDDCDNETYYQEHASRCWLS